MARELEQARGKRANLLAEAIPASEEEASPDHQSQPPPPAPLSAEAAAAKKALGADALRAEQAEQGRRQEAAARLLAEEAQLTRTLVTASEQDAFEASPAHHESAATIRADAGTTKPLPAAVDPQSEAHGGEGTVLHSQPPRLRTAPSIRAQPKRAAARRVAAAPPTSPLVERDSAKREQLEREFELARKMRAGARECTSIGVPSFCVLCSVLSPELLPE